MVLGLNIKVRNTKNLIFQKLQNSKVSILPKWQIFDLRNLKVLIIVFGLQHPDIG